MAKKEYPALLTLPFISLNLHTRGPGMVYLNMALTGWIFGSDFFCKTVSSLLLDGKGMGDGSQGDSRVINSQSLNVKPHKYCCSHNFLRQLAVHPTMRFCSIIIRSYGHSTESKITTSRYTSRLIKQKIRISCQLACKSKLLLQFINKLAIYQLRVKLNGNDMTILYGALIFVCPHLLGQPNHAAIINVIMFYANSFSKCELTSKSGQSLATILERNKCLKMLT